MRAEALINAGVDAIVIDTAHAHSKNVLKILREIKKVYPSAEVVAEILVLQRQQKNLLLKVLMP